MLKFLFRPVYSIPDMVAIITIINTVDNIALQSVLLIVGGFISYLITDKLLKYNRFKF